MVDNINPSAWKGKYPCQIECNLSECGYTTPKFKPKAGHWVDKATYDEWFQSIPWSGGEEDEDGEDEEIQEQAAAKPPSPKRQTHKQHKQHKQKNKNKNKQQHKQQQQQQQQHTPTTNAQDVKIALSPTTAETEKNNMLMEWNEELEAKNEAFAAKLQFEVEKNLRLVKVVQDLRERDDKKSLRIEQMEAQLLVQDENGDYEVMLAELKQKKQEIRELQSRYSNLVRSSVLSAASV